MFFIFGTPRSGTTLLTQCLQAHRDIVVPHETDFIIPMAFVFDRIADATVGRELIATVITQSSCFKNSLGEYLRAERIRELIFSCDYTAASILQSIYGELANVTGTKLAGDKSPNDLLFLRMLIKVKGIAPDTKIIHIVRDIRDVMVSLEEQQWGLDFPLYFPRFWADSNLYLRALYGNNPSQYLFLRYEDLAQSPEAVCNQICSFLGVDYQATMLDSRHFHQRYRGVVSHHRLYAPIDTARIGVYKQSLSVEQRNSFEHQAREALEVFGYKHFEVPDVISWNRARRSSSGEAHSANHAGDSRSRAWAVLEAARRLRLMLIPRQSRREAVAKTSFRWAGVLYRRARGAVSWLRLFGYRLRGALGSRVLVRDRPGGKPRRVWRFVMFARFGKQGTVIGSEKPTRSGRRGVKGRRVRDRNPSVRA